MKMKTGLLAAALAGVASLGAHSVQAIELTHVQKKLDQFMEYNSCTEASRTSQFPSVFLYFKAKNTEMQNIDGAVIETDFSDFHITFDHDKGEYFYRDIFSKERHYEQLHKLCEDGTCTFNMVTYPNIIFPKAADNEDIRIKFLNKAGKEISESKVNVGSYDAYAFEDQLIPFEAFMEDGKIMVTKLPSKHTDQYYTAGLHIGLGGKKHEIDVVVNKQQIEEGLLLSYPKYSDVSYLGIYMEPNNYDKSKGLANVENKIELYDQEKDFFETCKP